MKKIISITLLLTFGILANAQSAYDALKLSETNYEGTARTVAMGNAFTASGGDLGSITINPAGSAVAGYSQFAITPSLTFSTSTTQGVSPYDDGTLPYFERKMKSGMTRFSIPNIGMTFNWETGRKSGLKSMTFGIIINKTGGWDEDVYANGINNTTSFMGGLAAATTLLMEDYNAALLPGEAPYTYIDLTGEEAYDYMPWKNVIGYQSGMISTFGGHDDQFVGASEQIFSNPNTGIDEITLGGALDQTYGRRVTGSKYDYIFNLGANISDFLYLGANIGVSSLEYDYSEYFKEAAIDPGNFEISFDDGSSMCFKNMKYNYSYNAEASGLFAKIGFIATPASWLRIGGAIQTPTRNTIIEEWRMSGTTEFSDSKYNGSASSPYGEDRYTIISPMKANLGLALTFGSLGLISADYEMCNYGAMKFKGDSESRSYFDSINQDIQDMFGTAHSFRAGLEVKPLSSLAVRAGYNITGSGEKRNAWGDDLDPVYTQNVSFGLGYSSKGSFFADLAVRKTFMPDEYFMPYEDYIYDDKGYVSTPVPEILKQQSLWKVFLTFGWRF